MAMDRANSSSDSRFHHGASIHLTLPISCQICLGKVKDPAICSNRHVFCSSCLDRWLKNSAFCPACRIPINEKNPYKKILGSFDEESNQSLMNDPLVKSQIRRTRLKMMFEEFQREIEYLEETIKNYASENIRLKEENEELRLQLDDRDVQAQLKMHESMKNNSSKSEENGVADITTILKLSNKLQEMISANESMSHVNSALRKDIKLLQKEKDTCMRGLEKLQEESKFHQSPQKYNKYAMVALQTKVENYEREVQQWKKALKRADDYIEELTLQIEVEKHTNQAIVVSNNDTSRHAVLNTDASSVVLNNSSTTRISPANFGRTGTPVIMNSFNASDMTASEILKNISTKQDTTVSNEKNSGTSLDTSVITNQSSSQETLNTADVTSSVTKEQAAEKVDPHRFPACAKLLELTKARRNLSPPGRDNYSRNLFGSRDEMKLLYPKSSSCSPRTTMSSPSSSHASGIQQEQENESRHLKRSFENGDITVVIPSSEEPWLHPEYRRRINSPQSSKSYPAHVSNRPSELSYGERGLEYTDVERTVNPASSFQQYTSGPYSIDTSGPYSIALSPGKRIKTEKA